ncbi:MAG: ATP-binding protein [Candidatus Aenigmarchaeota archaeon]|nr:ATP-binding protein [Candidatus Aenigmarchaeota archaeon]
MVISEVVETIIGRSEEEKKKIGTKGAGYIGRHLVIGEYDWQLTTKVYFDFTKSHVVLICGKRGSGKSYSSGVIIEEFCQIEDEIRKKSAIVILDPMGIYWSIKFPNEQQKNLLKQWDLEPKGFKDYIEVFVPKGLLQDYIASGIPVDKPLTLTTSDFTIEDWVKTFEWDRTSNLAISLEKVLAELKKEVEKYDLKDIIRKLQEDKEIDENVKKTLISIFKTVDSWGIFEKEGNKIEDIVIPGKVSVIDLSRVKSNAIMNMIAAWITSNTYFKRVLSRKEEELAKIEGREQKYFFPITWLVFEEAQNFAPSDKKTIALEPILTIAKQGREPGVNLICITQMPNKLHQDLLSQTDIVISFRLTSREDLKALHSVMQTYMEEDFQYYFNKLPRIHGAALILDDNLERIFTAVIRPRLSWHAGGTAQIQV